MNIAANFVGSLIGEEDRLWEVDPPVTPEDLDENLGLRQTYETIIELSEKGFPPTAENILAQAILMRREAVTEALLDNLVREAVPGSLSTQAHFIREFASRKALAQAHREQEKVLREGVGSAVELHGKLQAVLDRAMPRGAEAKGFWGPELAEDYLAERQRRLELLKAGHQPLGLPKHWGAIAEDVEPFENGQIAIISGKRGQGKTTMALELVYHNAPHALVTLFHLETQPYNIQERLLVRATGYTKKALRPGAGSLDEAEIARQVRAIHTGPLQTVRYEHCAGQTVHYLIARMRFFKRLAAQEGKQFLPVIDYLGKISTAGFPQNMDDWKIWYRIMLMLKDAAENYRFPIVLLSQESERNGDRKTTAFSTEVMNQSQIWISIDEREKATNTLYVGPKEMIDGKPFGYDTVTEAERQAGRSVYSLPDGAGRMTWHRPGTYDSQVTLSVEKQNEGPLGSYTVRFLNYRYMIFGVDQHGAIIQPHS